MGYIEISTEDAWENCTCPLPARPDCPKCNGSGERDSYEGWAFLVDIVDVMFDDIDDFWDLRGAD